MKSFCKVKNCERIIVAKSLCQKHYVQFKRHGSVRNTEWLHGLSKSKIYKVWQGMSYRASNLKDKYYAGRGIKMSSEWKNFRAFYADMYKSYSLHIKKYGTHNTTLERINNNKGYSKSNCRWATYEEQWRNKRNSRLITYKGKTLTLTQWARRVGISQRALHNRLQKYSLKMSLELPKLNNKTRVKYINGHKKRGVYRKRFSNKIRKVV